MAKSFRLIIAALVALGSLAVAGQASVAPAPMQWRADDRLLVLAPHPDDEVIACAGVIQQAVARQIPVRVVFLTNGDANQWSFSLYRKRLVLLPAACRRMGQVRQEEAIAAGQVLGLKREQLTFLGYPDFRTLAIWQEGWGKAPATPGLLTRVRAVPYSSALRQGAPYKGEEILADLETVLREFRPTKVLVSHPADANVDHRALYLFTRVALWNLADSLQPEVHPYLVHYQNWPTPKPSRAPELSLPKFSDPELHCDTVQLGRDNIERKRQALLAHRSQYRSRPRYLMSFVRNNELFVSSETTAGQYGIETRALQRDGDQLVVSIGFAKAAGRAVDANISLFGYRPDRPFAEMPKIQARLAGRTHSLFDQRQRLAPGNCTVKHDADQIVLRVPLRLLGDPDRLLVSIRSRFSEVPADASAWRTLLLNPQQLVANFLPARS